MRGNELRRIVIIARILSEFVATHSNLEVFSDFQMQMRVVKAVRGSHRRDLLSASDALSTLHQDFLQMPVKRIEVARAEPVAVGVAHNDHVSPPLMAIARKNHDAIANAIDWIAKVSVATADSIPILTKMSVRLESTRSIISTRIRFPHRHVETIRQSDERGLS